MSPFDYERYSPSWRKRSWLELFEWLWVRAAIVLLVLLGVIYVGGLKR